MLSKKYIFTALWPVNWEKKNYGNYVLSILSLCLYFLWLYLKHIAKHKYFLLDIFHIKDEEL